jgi:hypothetical protein
LKENKPYLIQDIQNIRDVDLHGFNADPDTDPDLAYFVNVDPDPDD